MPFLRSLIYSYDVLLEAVNQPLLDLYETDDNIVIEMDLPGINPEDVLIKVFDEVVVIEGIKRATEEERRVRYICMERNFESFRRILRLPVSVDSMAGRAVYSDGVIKLTLPKVREKVYKIKIEK
jgi:HSP20 family protein